MTVSLYFGKEKAKSKDLFVAAARSLTRTIMVQKVINLQDIDPSPYQRRRYFDQDKLKELATSIEVFFWGRTTLTG